MPLRLTESDPYSRQIGLLNLAVLSASQHNQRLYVGMCGCKSAVANGILLISEAPETRCVFCGQLNKLQELPVPDFKWRETY